MRVIVRKSRESSPSRGLSSLGLVVFPVLDEVHMAVPCIQGGQVGQVRSSYSGRPDAAATRTTHGPWRSTCARGGWARSCGVLSLRAEHRVPCVGMESYKREGAEQSALGLTAGSKGVCRARVGPVGWHVDWVLLTLEVS